MRWKGNIYIIGTLWCKLWGHAPFYEISWEPRVKLCFDFKEYLQHLLTCLVLTRVQTLICIILHTATNGIFFQVRTGLYVTNFIEQNKTLQAQFTSLQFTPKKPHRQTLIFLYKNICTWTLCNGYVTKNRLLGNKSAGLG